MTIYVIEPDPISPASRFGPWLAEKEHPVTHLKMPDDAGRLSELRKSVDNGDHDLTGLIHCGGRMSALSGDEHPWILDAMALYQACVKAEIPVFGICLGYQILSHTFGGIVELSSETHSEEGPVTLELTPAAANDPIFSRITALEKPLFVYESHNDFVAKIPDGAVLLAQSERCPVEAFRYGSAVGVQFHPEASPDEIAVWALAEYGEDAVEQKKAEAASLDDGFRAIGHALLNGFYDAVVEEERRR